MSASTRRAASVSIGDPRRGSARPGAVPFIKELETMTRPSVSLTSSPSFGSIAFSRPSVPWTWVRCLAAGLLAGFLALPIGATEGAAPGTVAEELARIRGALDRLVALMEGQSTAGQTDLLMRRLEVAVARLAPDEAALRRQREQVDKAQEEKEQYERMRQVWEEQLAASDGDSVSEETLRRQQAAYEAQLEQLEQRRWQAEQRMRDLEASLDERRAVVRALEAEIDRRLGIE